MIKFYQGKYSELESQGRLSSVNNICFAERDGSYVLVMGGHEYGKDGGAIKIESGEGGLSHSGSKDVAAGTLFAFKGDQSLYRYNAASDWERIYDPTLSSAGFAPSASTTTSNEMLDYSAAAKDNGDSYQATVKDVTVGLNTLESKVSGAYHAGTALASSAINDTNNTVVVSKVAGIQRSEFKLTQNRDLIALSATSSPSTSAAIAPAAAAATILVTEKTLAEQTEDILANGFEIKKLVSTDERYGFNNQYRSQYALINKQTGNQLGATINLVKDQFLKQAEYVKAYTDAEAPGGYRTIATGLTEAQITAAKTAIGVTDASVTTVEQLISKYGDQFERYLKLTFAISSTHTGTGDNDAAADNDSTASDVESVVYINVNELFDSYNGINGVYVNQNTNDISAVVDTTTEKGLATHYNAAFLTVGANGLKVDGIKQEITGYIQDIGGIAASANTFVTEVGISSTDGSLTGIALSSYASGVNFDDISGTTALATAGKVLGISGGTVQDAINVIAKHIGSLDGSFDGSKTAEHDTQFVYAWTQADGILATSATTIDASNLKANAFQTLPLSASTAAASGIHTTGIDPIYFGAKSGSGAVHLQDALTSLATSVHDTISAMDMDLVGKIATDANNGGTANKTAPQDDANATTTNVEAYRIVNTIKQSDGRIYANDIEYSAPYIYFSGITETTKFSGTVGGGYAEKNAGGTAARIAVPGVNVNKALNGISNYIANLDLDWTMSGTTVTADTKPAAIGATNNYKVVNAVRQVNGQLSATTLDLTAANTRISGVAGYIPGFGDATSLSGVSTSAAKIALISDGASTAPSALGGNGNDGTVQKALEYFSNVIADYCSFHAADGNVI